MLMSRLYLNLVIKHKDTCNAIEYIQWQNVFSALELILIILKRQRQTFIGFALFTEM